jgi:hypothetical protein
MAELFVFLAWNGAVFGAGFWIGWISHRREVRKKPKSRRWGMTS